jgi:phosphoglucosamine mutase
MVFGTDGIRGVVDNGINAELAYDVGKGMAKYILKRNLNRKVIIGCDTRPSSDIYVCSIASALADFGIDVEIIGIVSTPMISFFVSRFDFSGGIMITASHNDYTYNGIKVFNEFGEKMNKKSELEIESAMSEHLHPSEVKGKINYSNEIVDEYINYLLQNFKLNLKEKTIVLDCANGSNYQIAPYVFRKLGANIITIGCDCNGNNINRNCGANSIENLIDSVSKYNADIGFAFDGDGDRLRIVLSDRNVLSGDDILLLFALYLKQKNELRNLTVAGTIMSNLGLEKTLACHKIKMIRSDVGDKNVIQLMKEKSISVGGESSGHICLLNYLPNCDALYNSLFYLKSCESLGDDFESILKSVIKLPSVIKNLKVDGDLRLEFDANKNINKQIKLIQKQNPSTKIVVRPSGTEPVIRIYVEGESIDDNKSILEKLEKIIKNSK